MNTVLRCAMWLVLSLLSVQAASAGQYFCVSSAGRLADGHSYNYDLVTPLFDAPSLEQATDQMAAYAARHPELEMASPHSGMYSSGMACYEASNQQKRQQFAYTLSGAQDNVEAGLLIRDWRAGAAKATAGGNGAAVNPARLAGMWGGTNCLDGADIAAPQPNGGYAWYSCDPSGCKGPFDMSVDGQQKFRAAHRLKCSEITDPREAMRFVRSHLSSSPQTAAPVAGAATAKTAEAGKMPASIPPASSCVKVEIGRDMALARAKNACGYMVNVAICYTAPTSGYSRCERNDILKDTIAAHGQMTEPGPYAKSQTPPPGPVTAWHVACKDPYVPHVHGTATGIAGQCVYVGKNMMNP